MTVNIHYFTSALWQVITVCLFFGTIVSGSSFSSLTVFHGSHRWPTLSLSHLQQVWESATRGAADRFTASFDCPMSSSQILSTLLGDIVARLHRRVDRYNNPPGRVDYIPPLRDWEFGFWAYVYLLSTKVFESFCYAISWLTWCYYIFSILRHKILSNCDFSLNVRSVKTVLMKELELL
jgi:hypothetical protein